MKIFVFAFIAAIAVAGAAAQEKCTTPLDTSAFGPQLQQTIASVNKLQAIVDQVNATVQSASSSAAKVVGDAQASLDGALTNVGGLLANLVGGIVKAITDLLSTLQGKPPTSSLEIGQAQVDQIKNIVASVVAYGYNATCQEQVDRAVGTLRQISEAIESKLDCLSSAVESLINSVVAVPAALVKTITDVVKTLTTNPGSLVSNIS